MKAEVSPSRRIVHKLLFSSPIGRLAYLGRILFPLAVVLPASHAFDLMLALDNHYRRQVIPFWLMLTFFFCACIPGYIYIILYAAMPRLRDIGISKWFALIYLVPITFVAGLFGLFLLLAPPSNRSKPEEQNVSPS